MYSNSNNQTTKRIYNLIDDIQAKLSKRKQSKKYLNQTDYQNNNVFPTNENIIILRSQQPNISNDNVRYLNLNPSQSQSLGQNVLNNLNNIPSENDIRKIIQDEFKSLISAYHSEINNNINNLDNKINIISNDCFTMKNEINNLNNLYKDNINNNNNKNNLDMENSLNQIKLLISDNVPYKEYKQKTEEIFEKINSNKNGINEESQKRNEYCTKLNNDINNINQKLYDLNLSLEGIKNKFNNFNDNYNNEINLIKQNNNKILTNEIKLNDLNNKNDIVQKKLDEYYKDLNDFKNNINLFTSTNSEKINDLNDKLINEKEKNKNNTEIKNIKESLNNDINNINKEIIQIKEKMKKLDGLKIEEISKIDINKINDLYKQCEDNKLSNPKLFEILEEHNVAITDLNTKLNKINSDYENETKKRYNQIIDRISKVEEDSKDIINIRNSLSSFNKKNEDDLFKIKIEKMDKMINNNKEEVDYLKSEIKNFQSQLNVIQSIGSSSRHVIASYANNVNNNISNNMENCYNNNNILEQNHNINNINNNNLNNNNIIINEINNNNNINDKNVFNNKININNVSGSKLEEMLVDSGGTAIIMNNKNSNVNNNINNNNNNNNNNINMNNINNNINNNIINQNNIPDVDQLFDINENELVEDKKEIKNNDDEPKKNEDENKIKNNGPRGNLPVPVEDGKNDDNNDDEFGDFDVIEE